MRHINLYMMSFALVASLCASAQTNKAWRMPVPGIKARQLMADTPRTKGVPSDRQSQSGKHTFIPSIKGVRMVSPSQATKATAASEDMVTRTVLTGWDETTYNADSQQPSTETGKITYDRYGRFSTVDYGDYKDIYAYTAGADGSKWTSKSITRQYTERTLPLYKELRTLDEQGRVTATEVYKNDQWTENGLALKEEREFDYTHNAQGVAVKHIDYDTYSGMAQDSTVRVWFAPTKSYIEVTKENSDGRMEIEVTADSYSILTYSPDYNGAWYLSSKETRFFSPEGRELGQFSASYYDDGSISNAFGYKTEIQRNVPEAGLVTEISYNFSSDQNTWVKSRMYVYTANYDLPLIKSNGDRTRKEYEYSQSKDKWVLRCVYTKTWNERGFLHEEYTSYHDGEEDDHESGLYKYSDKGEELGRVMMFSNGGYVLETDIDGKDASYYTFYDKDGNVTRRIKGVYSDDKDYDTSLVPDEDMYYELIGGQWVAVTSDLQFGDGDDRLECKFNSKGQMIQWDEYENGKHSEHVVYTYLPDGYIEQYYDMEEGGHLGGYTKVTRDSEGVITYIEYEYNSRGKVIYGTKKQTYPNGKVVEYRWDSDLQEFVYSHAYAKSLSTVAADGTQTHIERGLDSDGNVVETHKQVSFYSADMERNEQYTKENGQWVGIDKYERRTVSEPQFDLLGMQDPKANSDEYFHPVEDDDEDTNNIPLGHMSKQWAWKDGQWVISSQNGTEYEMIDANTLRSTSIIYSESKPDEGHYYDHHETTVITKKRDDSHRLTEMSTIHDIKEQYDGYTREDGRYETISTYSYNAAGLLTSETTEEYATVRNDGSTRAKSADRAATGTRVLRSSQTIKYYYSDIDVVNAISSASADAARAAFAVSGRTVTMVGDKAANGTAISLYALDGSVVATSADGSVTAPKAGVYVATCGSLRCKIVVR